MEEFDLSGSGFGAESAGVDYGGGYAGTYCGATAQDYHQDPQPHPGYYEGQYYNQYQYADYQYAYQNDGQQAFQGQEYYQSNAPPGQEVHWSGPPGQEFQSGGFQHQEQLPPQAQDSYQLNDVAPSQDGAFQPPGADVSVEYSVDVEVDGNGNDQEPPQQPAQQQHSTKPSFKPPKNLQRPPLANPPNRIQRPPMANPPNNFQLQPPRRPPPGLPQPAYRHPPRPAGFPQHSPGKNYPTRPRPPPYHPPGPQHGAWPPGMPPPIQPPPVPSGFGFQMNGFTNPPTPWSSGLFGCFEHFPSCFLACIFPCVPFGQVAEIVDLGYNRCENACLIFSIIYACLLVPCFYSYSYRTKLRHRFNLREDPLDDFCTHFWCMCCAIAQEYRELQYRGIDPNLGYETQRATIYQATQAPVPPRMERREAPPKTSA